MGFFDRIFTPPAAVRNSDLGKALTKTARIGTDIAVGTATGALVGGPAGAVAGGIYGGIKGIKDYTSGGPGPESFRSAYQAGAGAAVVGGVSGTLFSAIPKTGTVVGGKVVMDSGAQSLGNILWSTVSKVPGAIGGAASKVGSGIGSFIGSGGLVGLIANQKPPQLASYIERGTEFIKEGGTNVYESVRESRLPQHLARGLGDYLRPPAEPALAAAEAPTLGTLGGGAPASSPNYITLPDGQVVEQAPAPILAGGNWVSYLLLGGVFLGMLAFSKKRS